MPPRQAPIDNKHNINIPIISKKLNFSKRDLCLQISSMQWYAELQSES